MTESAASDARLALPFDQLLAREEENPRPVQVDAIVTEFKKLLRDNGIEYHFASNYFIGMLQFLGNILYFILTF